MHRTRRRIASRPRHAGYPRQSHKGTVSNSDRSHSRSVHTRPSARGRRGRTCPPSSCLAEPPVIPRSVCPPQVTSRCSSAQGPFDAAPVLARPLPGVVEIGKTNGREVGRTNLQWSGFPEHFVLTVRSESSRRWAARLLVERGASHLPREPLRTVELSLGCGSANRVATLADCLTRNKGGARRRRSFGGGASVRTRLATATASDADGRSRWRSTESERAGLPSASGGWRRTAAPLRAAPANCLRRSQRPAPCAPSFTSPARVGAAVRPPSRRP